MILNHRISAHTLEAMSLRGNAKRPGNMMYNRSQHACQHLSLSAISSAYIRDIQAEKRDQRPPQPKLLAVTVGPLPRTFHSTLCEFISHR